MGKKKKKSNFVRCFFCNKKINLLPFKCRRCGELFCGSHRLPEQHNCPGLHKESGNKWLSNRFSKKYDTKINPLNSEIYDSAILDTFREKDTKKDVRHLALSKYHRKRKGGQKHKKKISWIGLLFLVVILFYLGWNHMPLNFFIGETNNSVLDSQTIEIFAYVNSFRTMSGSPELAYEENLYEWVKAVAGAKQNNPDSYNTANEFLRTLEINFNISSMTNSYYTTYFISGGGPEEFLEQFNKKFNSRNLIKDSKYNRGAVYCGLDYCVLFVFDGAIENFNENVGARGSLSRESSKKEYFEKISKFFSSFSEDANDIFENVGSDIEETFSGEDRDTAEIEQEIHRLVNIERGNYNARALSRKNNLDTFAKEWSNKMMNEGFFEHSNLNFYYANIAGENIGETPIHYNVIGCGSTYTNDAIAKCFVDGWIESEGHHENMISYSFSMTGIGVSCDSSKCRATQVFSG